MMKILTKEISELKRGGKIHLSLIIKWKFKNNALMLSKISSERDMLTKANEILDKQAERFFKKSYPSLNIDKFSNHEVRAMVNEPYLEKTVIE